MEQIDERESVKIRTNIEGTPVYIVRKAKRERIVRIYRTEEVSNKEEDKRYSNYATVKTNMGYTYDIYKEGTTKAWCVSRIYS